VTAASPPGPGPDGEPPPPGVPARDRAAAAAGGAESTRAPDDDWDADADMARTLAACEAGLISIPREPDEPGGPGGPGGPGIVAGTAADPAELAAFGRAGGLAGPGQQAFAQGGTADVLPAGPLLTLLAEQAVTGEPGPPGLPGGPGGPGAAPAMTGIVPAGGLYPGNDRPRSGLVVNWATCRSSPLSAPGAAEPWPGPGPAGSRGHERPIGWRCPRALPLGSARVPHGLDSTDDRKQDERRTGKENRS
jgi:hypothetical protein